MKVFRFNASDISEQPLLVNVPKNIFTNPQAITTKIKLTKRQGLFFESLIFDIVCFVKIVFDKNDKIAAKGLNTI